MHLTPALRHAVDATTFLDSRGGKERENNGRRAGEIEGRGWKRQGGEVACRWNPSLEASSSDASNPPGGSYFSISLVCQPARRIVH